MRFDVTGLTEDDVRSVDETAVLDLDMDGLYHDLPERLNALAPDRFVAESACIELTYHLAREPTPFGAAAALADAAGQAIDDVEAGVNIRWLLRFNIRADRARPRNQTS